MLWWGLYRTEPTAEVSNILKEIVKETEYRIKKGEKVL